ncbi:LysR family transcriptional regulator (plasmid) [Pseudomonas luteola]|uniref:LysR substrate-binding domain-containing protein n=1 Tax=Pseudomonas TaxID=286 RepID=UPI003DA136E1
MNIRHLEAFRAVILCQTVTRAAEMLHISQPAATRLIGNLEEEIGFPLFERLKGRLHPTPEALVLYEEVQRSLLGVERIARVAQEIRSLARGSLRIACAPTLGLAFVPRAIASFVEAHPEARITLEVHSSQTVVDRVVGQRCDLGLIVLPNAYPSPNGEQLMTTRMLCALPKDHRLAGHDRIVPQDLQGERFISYPESIGSRLQVDALFATYGVERQLTLEAQLSASVCILVEQGAGVALIDVLSAVEYRGEGIVFKRFEPCIPMDFAILRPATSSSSRLHDSFVDHLKSFVKTQIAAEYLA